MAVRLVVLGILFVLVVLLITVPSSARSQEAGQDTSDHPDLRTWTDRSGTHHTEASFIECKDGIVRLKRKDGQTIKIPLGSLSGADREYVRQHTPGNNDAPADKARPPKEPSSSAQPRSPVGPMSPRSTSQPARTRVARPCPRPRKSSSQESVRMLAKPCKMPSVRQSNKPSVCWLTRRLSSRMTSSSVTKS